MRKIGLPKVRRILEKIVAEAPEGYCYTGDCIYFKNDGDPDCIIGHVFREVGFPVDPMQNGTTVNFQPGIEDRFTHTAIHYMMKVQGKQDEHTPWAEAIL